MSVVRHANPFFLTALMLALSACQSKSPTSDSQDVVKPEAGATLGERSVLKKAMDDDLAGSQWRLVELVGTAVTGSPESHFLKLGDDGRVQAKAGCNTMTGSYQSDGPMRIRFTKMATTMMACMDMSQEQALAAALEKADNYTLGENTLSLNKARMAPLARFERIQ